MIIEFYQSTENRPIYCKKCERFYPMGFKIDDIFHCGECTDKILKKFDRKEN